MTLITTNSNNTTKPLSRVNNMSVNAPKPNLRRLQDSANATSTPSVSPTEKKSAEEFCGKSIADKNSLYGVELLKPDFTFNLSENNCTLQEVRSPLFVSGSGTGANVCLFTNDDTPALILNCDGQPVLTDAAHFTSGKDQRWTNLSDDISEVLKNPTTMITGLFADPNASVAPSVSLTDSPSGVITPTQAPTSAPTFKPYVPAKKNNLKNIGIGIESGLAALTLLAGGTLVWKKLHARNVNNAGVTEDNSTTGSSDSGSFASGSFDSIEMTER